jgi:regulator of cell morphogenesis and NO signaling
MSKELGTTVRDLAVQVPGATRVFEKLGIDYCCGGGKSLHDACMGAGISLEEVMQALEHGKERYSGESAGDWQDRPLADLAAHIVEKHHGYTRAELLRLEQLAAKVAGVHGARHPELAQVLETFRGLQADLGPHMLKEEQVLFPYIAQLEQATLKRLPPPTPFFGTVRNPIAMMVQEHDDAGDLLRKLRSATSEYTVPSDGCVSYKTLYQALEELERDLHQHIHLENNILFPRAVRMENEV